MDFRPTAIDVPGDFSNPMLVVTVVIWALGLAAITVSWLVLRRSARPSRLTSVVAWGILLIAYVSTPLSQRVLGGLLYFVGDLIKGRDPWVSVGFIGGPPILPAPVFALLSGVVAALLLRGKSFKNAA